MKKLFLIFCLFFATQTTFANTIDSLKTDKDVRSFLTPLIVQFYYRNADENWRVKSWQKLDLNGDNNTDLVATEIAGRQNFMFIAIAKNDNTFQVSQIIYGPVGEDQSIEIVYFDNSPHVVFHGFKESKDWRNKPPRTDTLVYKFNSFVEVNNRPAHYNIDSITYSTVWGWKGRDNTPPPNTDSDQNLVIDRAGNATYSNNRSSTTYTFTSGSKRPPRNPKTDLGIFKGKIKSSDLNEIYDLINYIDIQKLKDKYAISWTDDTTCYIRVKFIDGTVKYIADYGGQGTFGLKSLFHKLFALRDSQDWK
ncbi:MAG: DUF6438 domain-containing protein [Bacteroidota bacterium]